MAVNVQLITHPGQGVKDMLAGRLGPGAKKGFETPDFSAVALVQGRLVDMIYAADVAEKAADVQVFDLRGSCPQHLTMIGIFGEVAAVKAGLEAIQADPRLK